MKCIKFWSEDIGLCYLKCFTKTHKVIKEHSIPNLSHPYLKFQVSLIDLISLIFGSVLTVPELEFSRTSL